MTESPPPRDRLYAEPRARTPDFTFDRQVAEVFADMIQRSVPGYATVVNMTGVLAGEYVQAGSTCYDLGCSLGASSLAMQHGIRTPGCRIIAVDNSQAMLDQAALRLRRAPGTTPIELRRADLLDTPIEDASMVVMNFTLQFIEPGRRLELLRRIRRGLRPGGILVLSEKITFRNAREEALQIELHHAFKRANGYADLEISQKRSALENVLTPETLERHHQRLDEAGFAHTELWFQCFNFASLIAAA